MHFWAYEGDGRRAGEILQSKVREVRLAVKAELLILVASKIHFGVFSGDFSSFFFFQIVLSVIRVRFSITPLAREPSLEIENYVTKLVNRIVLITDC